MFPAPGGARSSLSAIAQPDSTPHEDEDARLRHAIQSGSELVAAVGGGAVGLIGGPIGSMGGAAAGVVFTRAFRRVGLEVYERLLAPRQQQRVGAALGMASRDADNLIASGVSLRCDDFFDATDGRRSDAEELMEGVLLHAADAYQELKLRHLAAILPALAFRPDVSAADGHWITDIASRLTWRQLVVLAIFTVPPVLLTNRDDLQEVLTLKSTADMLSDEVIELGALGLLGATNRNGYTGLVGGTVGGLEGGIWNIGLSRWRLTDSGRLVSELARLDDVSQSYSDSVLQELLDEERPV